MRILGLGVGCWGEMHPRTGWSKNLVLALEIMLYYVPSERDRKREREGGAPSAERITWNAGHGPRATGARARGRDGTWNAGRGTRDAGRGTMDAGCGREGYGTHEKSSSQTSKSTTRRMCHAQGAPDLCYSGQPEKANSSHSVLSALLPNL